MQFGQENELCNARKNIYEELAYLGCYNFEPALTISSSLIAMMVTIVKQANTKYYY